MAWTASGAPRTPTLCSDPILPFMSARIWRRRKKKKLNSSLGTLRPIKFIYSFLIHGFVKVQQLVRMELQWKSQDAWIRLGFKEEFTVLLVFFLSISIPSSSLFLSFLKACITTLFGFCAEGHKGRINIRRPKRGGFVPLSEWSENAPLPERGRMCLTGSGLSRHG